MQNELEVKNIAATQKSASYLDLYLDIDGGKLKIKHHYKRMMISLFQSSNSSVAIFQQDQRMQFTFHKS